MLCAGGGGGDIRGEDKSRDRPPKKWNRERESRKDGGREGGRAGRWTGDGFDIRGRKL